jgi:5-methylthioribose kinase
MVYKSSEYLVNEVPSVLPILGISKSTEDIVAKLTVSEVGDGNLNFVYIVKGPAGAGFTAYLNISLAYIYIYISIDFVKE